MWKLDLLQHAPDAPDLSPPEHQLGLIVFELAGKFLHDVLSNLTESAPWPMALS